MDDVVTLGQEAYGDEQPDEAPSLYPRDADEHARLVSWLQRAFQAADTHRQPYLDKWTRYHKVYKMFQKRTQGSWRSSVYIPYVFGVIENITPRLVAQLPEFIAEPILPDDVLAAENMATLLNYSAGRTHLREEQIKMTKQQLKYGTGLAKTYWRQRIGYYSQKKTEQLNQQPVNPDTGQPMEVIGGSQPQPSTKVTWEKKPYVIYEGPDMDWVDIFHFWVSPEATSLDDARYVIQRYYREASYVQDKIDKGIYRLPPGVDSIEGLATERRDQVIEREEDTGYNDQTDSTRKSIEILEFHLDDRRIITFAGRKLILRVMERPWYHDETPYLRTVDYLQEGEFWGMGEVEPLEGMQDAANAIINQRIDNVRLSMDAMSVVRTESIESLTDLRRRPGGVVRAIGDYPLEDIVKPLETQDVTQSAYLEAQALEELIERTSGVSAAQIGQPSPQMPDTATGFQGLQEAGNTKFALKSVLAELLGMSRLARQWGSLYQQYLTEDRFIKLVGADGQTTWDKITAEDIQGGLDYTVKAQSMVQTESVRREQEMTLIQTAQAVYPPAVPALFRDLLKLFDRKDLSAYMGPEAQQAGLLAAQNQQAMTPGAPAQGVPPDQQPNAASIGSQPVASLAQPGQTDWVTQYIQDQMMKKQLGKVSG